jgi:hypothetical protein
VPENIYIKRLAQLQAFKVQHQGKAMRKGRQQSAMLDQTLTINVPPIVFAALHCRSAQVPRFRTEPELGEEIRQWPKCGNRSFDASNENAASPSRTT